MYGGNIVLMTTGDVLRFDRKPRVIYTKCSYAHRQVEEQLGKRSKKNGDKSAVAMLKRNEHHHRTGRLVVNVYSSNTRQLGCVFQDMEPPMSTTILRKSSKHTEANPMCSIH